jgi:hypothetical protein
MDDHGTLCRSGCTVLQHGVYLGLGLSQEDWTKASAAEGFLRALCSIVWSGVVPDLTIYL